MGHKAKRTNLSSNKTRKNRQKTQERKRRRDCKSLEWKSEIFKFRNQLKPFGLTIRGKIQIRNNWRWKLSLSRYQRPDDWLSRNA